MKKLFLVGVLGLSYCNLSPMNFSVDSGSSKDLLDYPPVSLEGLHIHIPPRGDGECSSLSSNSDEELGEYGWHDRLLDAGMIHPGLGKQGIQLLIDQAVLERVPYENLDSRVHGEVINSITGEMFELGDSLLRLPCSHVFHEATLVRTLVVSSVCPECFVPVVFQANAHRQGDCFLEDCLSECDSVNNH